MNPRKTLITALVFLLLVAGYLYDQHRVQTQTRVRIEESRLLPFSADQVVSIEIKSTATADSGEAAPETILLERENGGWALRQPVATGADTDAINQLLSIIGQTGFSEPFDVEQADLAGFGMDPPSMTVTLTDAAGQTRRIEFGNVTSSGDQRYARLPEGPLVLHTVWNRVGNLLAQSVEQLRDRRLVPANLNTATRVTLVGGVDRIVLDKRDGQWWIEEPIDRPGDPETIASVLQLLSQERASDFQTTSTQALAAIGLAAPTRRAVFVAGDEHSSPTQHALHIGDPVTSGSTHRWAALGNETTIFQVTERVAGLLAAKPDELRAKRLFSLQPDDIGRVVIVDALGRTTEIHREPGAPWQFAGTEDDVDQTAADTYLTKALAFSAVDFFDDNWAIPEVTGLDSPNIRMTLVSHDGQTSESIKTGKMSHDQTFVYATFSGRQTPGWDLVGVDKTQPGQFFTPYDDLIERALFDVELEQVHSVDVREGDRVVRLARDERGLWTALGVGSDTEPRRIETTRINNLLFALLGMEWTRRLDPDVEKDALEISIQGLENPQRSMTVHDAEGNVLIAYAQANADNRRVYIRTGLAPEDYRYFIVDKGLIARMMQEMASLLH